MAIPAIPAQGAPWLTYAQGVDDEIRTGRLSDSALRAAFALARDAAAPISTAAEVNDTAGAARIMFMDSVGRLLRGGAASGDLQRSTDGGSTWATVTTLPRPVTGVRQLDNGELLIETADNFPTNTIKSALYITSGYAGSGTVTTRKVLDADDYQQGVAIGSWGFGGAGDIYVVSEYDSKAPGSRSATQKVWLTTDSFATTSVIYDHGTGSLGARHVHGAVYDPYRDAIWITLGDYTGDATGDRRIRVSWDRGTTWQTVTGAYQPTAIYAFPECVVFGQDGTPNGVLRINQPSPTNLRVEVAYKVSNYISTVTNQPALSHVAEAPFRASSPGAPLLLPFSVGATGQRGLVLATTDGYTFQEVWRSPAAYGTTGYGPKRAIGPTPDGRILINGQNGATFWHTEAPAPVRGLTNTIDAAARTLTRLIPRRAFRQIANQSSPDYQSIPNGGVLTELLLSTAPPVYEEDFGELFVPSPDGLGVTVTRDAIVTISVDSGFSAPSQRVVIKLDAAEAVNLGASSIPSTTMRIRAGQKLSTWSSHWSGSAVTVFGTSSALVLSAWETY